MIRHISLAYLDSGDDSEESLVFDWCFRGGDIDRFYQYNPERIIIEGEMVEESRELVRRVVVELIGVMTKYELPIFQMFYGKGLDVEQISVVLGCSVQNVYRHLKRVRAKLELLGERLLDEADES